jgi:hypothetical protein
MTKRPRRIRVDVERSPADICRETVRQLDPNATDEEIAAGLRELADQIEAEALREAV